MENELMCCYVTINHLNDFDSTEFLRIGQEVRLQQDHSNAYDDEAIAVYTKLGKKIGYVANSVSTVCRGTYSAGRLYDRFAEETDAMVRFVAGEDDFVIAEVVPLVQEK